MEAIERKDSWQFIEIENLWREKRKDLIFFSYFKDLMSPFQNVMKKSRLVICYI